MAQSQPSARQREVLRHAEAGKSIPEIAKTMKITPSGVRDHVRKLLAMGVEVQVGGKPYGEAASNGQSAPPPAPAAAAPPTPPATTGVDVVAEVVLGLQRQVDELVERQGQLNTQLDRLSAEIAQTAAQERALRAMIAAAAAPSGDGAPALTGRDAAQLATAGSA